MKGLPLWITALDETELNFIKNFVLSSGSLKQMAQEYPCRIHIASDDPDGLKGMNMEKVQKASIATYPIIKPYRDAIESKHQWTIAAVPSAAWAKKVFPDLKKNQAIEALWNAILSSVHVSDDTDNDPIAAWEASSLITLYAHRTSPLVQVGSASYYQRYDLLLPDSDPFALRAERQLTDGREPEGTAECIVTLDYPTVNPAQPLRSLTGEMMGAGYTVAEGVRSEQYYDVGGVLLGSAEWLITMTFLDGSWYVVESVQLS